MENTAKIKNMERLIATVQRLSDVNTIEEIIHIVRTEARELTGADGATFVLRDKDLCYYVDEDAISPLWKGSRFPMETCISGWAMLNKKAAVIPDIYVDDRIPIDAYRPTFVKSLVMTPIRRSDPLGAIGNYWASEHHPSEEEISLLQGLADITAVSIQNIYEQQRVQVQLKEREQLLSHIEDQKKKLEEYSQIIAHNLRAPLSNMGLLNELILEAESMDEKLDYVARMQKLVNSFMETFNELIKILAIQKDFKIESEVIDLDSVMINTRKLLYGDIVTSGAQISWDFTKAPVVYMPSKYIDSIFLNLVSNAIRYRSPERVPEIRLSSYKKDGNTIMEVADNGLGIDLKKHKDELFILQKTFHDHPEAKGFGLFITRNQIVALHGEISVESEPGKGTTFKIVLPQNIMAGT